MKKIIWPLLLLSITFSISCEVENVKTSHQSFFDINDFLEKEMNQLSNLKSIKKKVTINNKVDEEVLDSFDLKKDLEIFKNSNINIIAWLDKYQVDSILNDKGLLTNIKYKAKSKKLKTQEMLIDFSSGKVNKIFIKNNSSNQVTELNQELIYSSMIGYSVLSNQKVILSDEQSLKIEVEFLEK